MRERRTLQSGTFAAPRLTRQQLLGRRRTALAWLLCTAGLVGYNWWILIPFKPGLMRSPNEMFSNLEVNGQPFASMMQHADLISGLLLLAAFVVAGTRTGLGTRREQLAMLAFAAGAAAGGIFPETCADAINATCKELELTLRLPASQYLHLAAGAVEFGGATITLVWAARRTRGQHSRVAAVYRTLFLAAFVGYPLLGVMFLLDRFGAVIEAAAFACISVLLVVQLLERTRERGAQLPQPVPARVRQVPAGNEDRDRGSNAA
ncbi:MAG TPA: DUF998 domain-containing protein [Streptosporangiaceae bacterium]|nr:DUF998 domain-containing protein [Streptosporangiaceae bacterium]